MTEEQRNLYDKAEHLQLEGNTCFNLWLEGNPMREAAIRCWNQANKIYSSLDGIARPEYK